MVWRDLLARLAPGRDLLAQLAAGRNDADAFLDALIATRVALRREYAPDLTVYAAPRPSPVQRIRIAEQHNRSAFPDAFAWWDTLYEGLRRRFPDGDALALHWLCDVRGCQARVRETARRLKAVHLFDLAPTELLLYWVEQHPTPEAIDAIAAAVRDCLPLPDSSDGLADDYYADRLVEQVVDGLVQLLVRLDTADAARPLARGQALVADLVAAHRAERPGAERLSWMRPGRGSGITLGARVLAAYVSALLRAGRLSRDELEALLLEYPQAAYSMQSPGLSDAVRAEVAATTDRLLARAAVEEADSSAGTALAAWHDFAGMDHFLAACRWYERHPKYVWRMGQPVLWPDVLLQCIRAPSEEDAARAGELASYRPATLLPLALRAPHWASLVEGPLGWPGLSSLVHWLKRHGGPQPWSAYRPVSGEEDDELGAVDRATAVEATERLGEERMRQILKHPVARSLYGRAMYDLQAVLGWNAAEVEDGFLKRNKRAVRALGMLPDEGDALERYQALRRFAREARQFKPQRQASEQLAAESGIANLAVTLGYDDPAQLEWAMEARIAAEVAPGDGRWTVGDYTVCIEPGESAPLRVERAGRSLKAVPAAVRQAPAYAEIAAAREEMQAQWARLRRRLDVAMALGETLDYAGFAPALTTPAGRALLPALVLRCWRKGATEPVDVLDWRTLTGEPIEARDVERFQVAHPLHLAAAGTLPAWQPRLVAERRVQPFNQLFRTYYPPTEAEQTSHASRRLAGRETRPGTLVARLKAAGWWLHDGTMVRRFPGRLQARLLASGAALYMASSDYATIEQVQFVGPHWTAPKSVHPLYFSEALRDADLANAAAATNRASAPVSRETVDARAALARTLAPAAVLDDATVRLAGHTLDLRTGIVRGPDGQSIALDDLPLPAAFPYPSPDPGTAIFAARLVHLANPRSNQ
jgi:hypothetical protein